MGEAYSRLQPDLCRARKAEKLATELRLAPRTTFASSNRNVLTDVAERIAMAQSRPLSILVVDDYPDSAEATAQFLILHEHDARIAQTCAEALTMVNGAAFVPDVVLLDIRLPDGNGFSLGEELCRLLPVRPVLIAITGLPNQDANCQTAGFDHYILKPADPNALAALLARYKK